MKTTTTNKKTTKKILGYLLAFAIVLCTSNVSAQCTASGNMCICPMIFAPVCGCDGVQYNNSCLADCQGVTWTPIIAGVPCSSFVPPPYCELKRAAPLKSTSSPLSSII